ncbi:MAG: transporter substrate-binding domain-containing protein, partial [Acidimicrobiia bacterium]|nr:transporter substrate-binding domain-containing protein [Acidimicrobiia bacterium]
MRRTLVIVGVISLALAACTQTADTTTTGAVNGGAAPTGDTLAAVQSRGTLRCGVNDAVPGFGFVDADGNYSGFDIDYCKAVAVAVVGDAEAIEYIPLTADTRFTALQSGEVDVLIRNTTWTASRDGGEGTTFLTTTFYDGQGMMVRADSGFTSVDDMAGTSICVLTGTTTELNLATRFGAIPYTPQTFSDNEQLQAAFIAEQCDGWTSDKSQLAAVRSKFPESEGGPDSLVILDETF